MIRVALLAGLVLASTWARAVAHTDLTPAEVQALLDVGGNIVILDVREASEFCDSTYTPPGHISGAINMPWNSGYLQEHYDELSPVDSTIAVCRSENRSNTAANFLDSVGFTNVFDMLGGMNAWLWETEICAAASTPGLGGFGASGLVLGSASPNPFNSKTEISYTIPEAQESGRVTVSIYDAGGRLVSRIVDTDQNPGSHRVVWDGNDSEGRHVRGGVYFYQLAWNGQTVTRRMVVLQ